LNAESAERRVKLKEFEEAEETRKREAMSELEKAQADAEKWQTQHGETVAEWEAKYAELETQFQEFKIGLVVERAAGELGFEHPQDAMALVNLSALAIDDDGKVTGFDEQLQELAKSGRLAMRNTQTNLGTPKRADGTQTGGSAKRQDQEKVYQDQLRKFHF